VFFRSGRDWKYIGC